MLRPNDKNPDNRYLARCFDELDTADSDRISQIKHTARGLYRDSRDFEMRAFARMVDGKIDYIRSKACAEYPDEHPGVDEFLCHLFAFEAKHEDEMVCEYLKAKYPRPSGPVRIKLGIWR